MEYWDVHKGYADEFRIGLIKAKHWDQVPDGTDVITILGQRLTKGKDYIDLDTRGGWLAVGIPIEFPAVKQTVYT